MPRLASIPCLVIDWPKTPAARNGVRYTHPGVAGSGVLYGPSRSVPTRLTAHTIAIDRADAEVTQAAIAALVDAETIAIDPDGDGLGTSNVPGCRVLTATSSARRVAGLATGYTFLVIAELEVLLPETWPA